MRVLGEGRPAEVCVLGEGRSDEVCVLGEGRSPEIRVLGEGRLAEVRVLGEGRPAEVRGLGEGRLAEVRGLGEGRPVEVRVAVELGRRKITFLNREATERIENGSSAEIEIKVTPDSLDSIDCHALLFDDVATALAHLNEDSATYVLFFVELCIVCGDVFRLFVFTRIFETLK